MAARIWGPRARSIATNSPYALRGCCQEGARRCSRAAALKAIEPPRKLVTEPAQRVRVVATVPFGKQRGLERNLPRAPQRASRHAGRAPFYPAENRAVRLLKADQIVAAVTGRPEYEPVAWLTQGLNGLDKKRGRQRRAVAVDEKDAIVRDGEQVTRRAEQHIAQVGIGLQQQTERRRKQLPQDLLRSRRRIDAVAAASDMCGDGRYGCRDVPQEAAR